MTTDPTQKQVLGVWIAWLILSATSNAIAQTTTVSTDSAAAVSTDADSAPFNVKRRVQWTTSRIQGTPEPPDEYTTERAFPNLKFVEPISMCLVPGTNSFCVATRRGKIYVFENSTDVKQAPLLIDIGKTVYGIAFHPNFESNGYFFVSSFANPSRTDPTGARLSRFRVNQLGELLASKPSEEIILTWPSGGHNGGCIRFGPDGLLYISVGDGSGISDTLLTGQRIDDLSGSILRIDVDHPTAGQLYSIPKDNPFVNTHNARGEIWSYGHRHVWKFSFDDQNRLWAGDVGQDLWEAIHLVKRGGNYGWSVTEGSHPFRPDRPRGPTEIIPPIVEHTHSHFRSVTGGYVNRSPRLPELEGAYIYGDYDTGAIWSLIYEDEKVVSHKQLVDTQLRIVEFAQDETGEVYVVDFVGGRIHRIIKAPQSSVPEQPFPQLLSETGLFSSTETHTPAPGVIPYSVNAPLWSDGAVKDSFIALPNDSQIEMDAIHYPHRKDYADLGWKFPDGAVLVKTFSFALDPSQPNSLQRLETRILHFRQMPGNDAEYGAQVWNGYTYIWNEEQTDAILLDNKSLDRELLIADPTAPGGVRKQVWHFPSRSECALCHTMGSKYVLGVTTLQLNKVHDYGGHRENQLELLSRLGVFTKPLPNPASQLPALANYQNPHEPLNLRARAYLHANCAHCHRKWGGGNADFELQASLPLSRTGLIAALPGQGNFDIQGGRILVPGDPGKSLIWKRMAMSGLGRMPHVGSTVIDTKNVAMVHDWILSLENESLLHVPGAKRPRLPATPSVLSRVASQITSSRIGLVFCLSLIVWWWRVGPTRIEKTQ